MLGYRIPVWQYSPLLLTKNAADNATDSQTVRTFVACLTG